MNRYAMTLAVLALAGCSKAPDTTMVTHDLQTMGAADPQGVAAPAPAARNAPPIAVSVPQMAYLYKYGFRLPDDAIARAQDAHVALCDRLGPARCQLLALSRGVGEGEAKGAALKLRVDSPLARAFGARLQSVVAQAGGRSVSSSIVAEDVSKEIVDTEARLRQRTLLVERLTAILRTRTGKVSELVEAERSVAAAQEEIDQARGWLAELRGRVATSTFEIDYAAVAAQPARSGSVLGDAVAQSASAFVIGLGSLATIAILFAPWALLAGAGWWLWRRFGRRVIDRSDDHAI